MNEVLGMIFTFKCESELTNVECLVEIPQQDARILNGLLVSGGGIVINNVERNVLLMKQKTFNKLVNNCILTGVALNGLHIKKANEVSTFSHMNTLNSNVNISYTLNYSPVLINKRREFISNGMNL